jgi:hypothetical protein
MRRATQAAFLIAVAVFALQTTEAHAVKGDPCNQQTDKIDGFRDKDGNLRPSKVAAFIMHQQYEIYRKADTDCNGKLSALEIEKFENSQEVKDNIDQAQHYVKRVLASGDKIPLSKDGDPSTPILGNSEPTKLDTTCESGWKFFLRGSAENIGAFDCPKDLKSASGAQFGYSRDNEAMNTSWSAKGVAALAYAWRNTNSYATPYVAGMAFSPWVSFNRVTDSKQSLKSKEVDLLSYGATGEIAIGELLGGVQYFRGKEQLNSDFEGTAKSWSTTAEWQPVTALFSSSNRLGPYLLWEIDPIARGIYTSRRNGSTDPIFTNSDEVFRVGSIIALNISLVPDISGVPKWLQSSSFNTSYEWLRNTNSGETYRLYNATLYFAIDPTSNLGLQVNYQRGELEETGQKVDLLTAGLAAKW